METQILPYLKWKKRLLLFLLLSLQTPVHFCKAQLNPGFENNGSTAAGWRLNNLFGDVTWSINGTNLRSGSRRLFATVTTSNARNAENLDQTITIPSSGTNYVHTIGHVRSADNSDQASVSALSLDGGTSVTGTLSNTTAGSWVRFTCSGTATNGKTYYPSVTVDGNYSGSGDDYGFDDFIIYTSTSSGVDLTAPNAPTSLSASTTSPNVVLNWTDGTDNATNISGISGVLILRYSGADKTGSKPTPLNHTYYSTTTTIGPATIVNGGDTWTVVYNGTQTGTYTDVSVATGNYTYVVYMRDKAYNYSTGTAIYYSHTQCTTAPSKAVISSPANGGTDIVLSNTSLQWTNGGGATSYDVYWGTVSPGTSRGNQSYNYYGITTQNSGTTYYWRIDSKNSCGTTTGDIWSYTTTNRFINSTATSCGTDFGSSFGTFTRNISVSGLPGTLSAGGTVLKQINIKLGSSSCKKNLSTYDFRITSPSGTNLDFITDLMSRTTNVWINASFRDHSSLEKIRTYPSDVQDYYFPFNIGYYAVETAGTFQSTFNGQNPNGTWVFSIKESATAGTEISFESVELVFGAAYSINDLTGTSSNNSCSSSSCIDSTQITIGTNNGYSTSDPNYPGSTVDGCSWNGSNDNSAWYQFRASKSTAYISISGLLNPSGGSPYDMQPIILQAYGSCTVPTDVPTGGCPDDESINNTSYLSTNGGGITGSGNIYVNGISANCEFKLSGLSTSQRYYLYVDGNNSTSSSFYIEGSGITRWCAVLPVEWGNCEVDCEELFVKLKWVTLAQINNSYFQAEGSIDGQNWEPLATLDGAGTLLLPKEYRLTLTQQGFKYYRIKQVDYDGDYSYSDILYCSKENVPEEKIFYLDANNQLNWNNEEWKEYQQLQVFDVSGRIVLNTEINQPSSIDLSALPKGIHLVVVHNRLQTKKTNKKIIIR